MTAKRNVVQNVKTPLESRVLAESVKVLSGTTESGQVTLSPLILPQVNLTAQSACDMARRGLGVGKTYRVKESESLPNWSRASGNNLLMAIRHPVARYFLKNSRLSL